ncbi:hypothetical protein LXL04_010193 [Taraxacum kok-saghyz]
MDSNFLNHIRNSARVNANLRQILTDHRLDSAISFAINNGVKSMDLNLGLAKYRFPDSFASRSINVLRLRGFSSCVIAQDIFLHYVNGQDDLVEEHISTLRKLETVIFNRCAWNGVDEAVKLLKLKVPPTPSEEKCDCTPAPPPAEEDVTEPPPAATEETTTETLETAPGDYCFPATNQSRHCFTRYVEYHRSVFNQFKTNF